MQFFRSLTLIALLHLFQVSAHAAPTTLKFTLQPTPEFKAQSCTLLLTTRKPWVRRFKDLSTRVVKDENGFRGEAFFVSPEKMPQYLDRKRNPDAAESFAFAFAAARESKLNPGNPRTQILNAVHRMIREEEGGQLLRLEFPLFEEIPAGVRDPRPLEFGLSTVAPWSGMSLLSVLQAPKYLFTLPVVFAMMLRDYWNLLKFHLGIPSAAVRKSEAMVIYLPQSTPGYGVLAYMHLGHFPDELGTYENGFVIVEVTRGDGGGIRSGNSD